jgi:D-sedoheptulose 7-phosphate isomerase
MTEACAAGEARHDCSRRHQDAIVESFVTGLNSAISGAFGESFATVVDLVRRARQSGGRIFVMGNGGSAATASHLVCDLMKTSRIPGGPPIRAYALTDNVPLLTAWANDDGYEAVFAEQLANLVAPTDLVIAVSVSGRSPNILAALHAATRAGATRVGFLGSDGGAALELVDAAMHVCCEDQGIVESVHLAMVHALAKALMVAA